MILPSNVIAKAFSAGFHLVAHRALPFPVGSSARVAKYRHFDAACSLEKCPRARVTRRYRALMLSIALVPDMKFGGCPAMFVWLAGPGGPPYGETVRNRGICEESVWAGRSCSMGCEPVLVDGRPCDLSGCAVSANP